jgi:hypothetical protein
MGIRLLTRHPPRHQHVNRSAIRVSMVSSLRRSARLSLGL